MITRRGSSHRRWLVVALAVCLSLLVHVLVLPRAGRWLLGAPADPLAHVSFVDADALDAPSMESLRRRHEAAPVVEPPPEPPEPSPRSRQLVETAPTDERRPTDADYLAEQDNSVDKESRTERYKINPDVLAPTYSDASKAPEAAADQVASEAESAPAGALPDLEQPGAGPPRSLLPARFQPASRVGATAPTRAGAVDTPGVGAPQNDLLREDIGDSVALNTLELAGAKYLNQVRRHVNFYWSQQIDNLPPSLDLSRPVYETRVSVVLDRHGALEAFAVTQPSGDGRIDDCIQKAFTMSAPYGAPPPELLGADGRLRLPNFAFTLQIVRTARP